MEKNGIQPAQHLLADLQGRPDLLRTKGSPDRRASQLAPHPKRGVARAPQSDPGPRGPYAGVRAMRTTLLIAAALLVLANPVQAAPGPDAVVACLMGQCAMALRKNHDHWSKLDAFEATEAAQRYAAKRCKGSGIGEG